MTKLKYSLLLGATLLSVDFASAATMLYDITAGSGGSAFTGFNGNWGFAFSVDSTTTVGSLGLWDEGSNGFVGAHTVGIFDSGGGSITSAVVDNTSIVVASTNANGRWLFTDLTTTITLNPGSYTLGFFNPSGGTDPFRGGGITTSYMAGASFETGKARSGAASFAYPDANSPSGGGWVGPNFATGAMAVPEPTSAAFAGIAVIGLLRRRRA